jgi:ABC-type lipoprotein export system ATPase subunit
MWKLIEDADPEWVLEQDSLDRSVDDAIRTITQIIYASIDFARPILRIVTQMIIIITIAGYAGLCILVIVGTVMIIGTLIIQSNYKSRKEIRKQTTDIMDNVRNQASNFFINMLNGRGRQAREEIVSAWSRDSKIYNDHSCRIHRYYTYMEILHCVMVSCALVFISTYVSGKEFAVIFFSVTKVCDNSWSLFHSFNGLVEITSDWGSMEKLLEAYKPMNTTPVAELHTRDIIKSLDGDISEIRIKGDSGGGKTTYVMNIIIRLYKKFYVGQWLYMDQKMNIPKSSSTIHEIMSHFMPCGEKADVAQLFKYAQILGIDNVINEQTLNSTFTRPSGGEEKRIMFLRAILPILCDVSHVKVIFCDEVTAGLDDVNWNRVRIVIDDIKKKGVKFVTIDHHEFEPDITYNVKKEIEPLPIRKDVSVKPSWFDNLMDTYRYRYKNPKDTGKKTRVHVWLEEIDNVPEYVKLKED